nr:zinc finger MYM-type protein 1-like [Nicotiana tomentosiformis]
MDRYLTKPKNGEPSSSASWSSMSSQIAPKIQRETNPSLLSNVDKVLDLKSSELDPKERMPISDYSPNIRDEVRRYYINKGPCQPIGHAFPKTKIGSKMRQFSPTWFRRSYSQWLQQSEKVKGDYRMRLNASIDVVRFLLILGFSFRGHDESEESEYKGGFLELLEWHRDRHPDLGRIILRHAPQNDIMIYPTIQKEIVEACAKETTKAIIEDLDGNYFTILVDESKDVSHKEQMALILRYINKSGMVIERFLGIVHADDTSYSSL